MRPNVACHLLLSLAVVAVVGAILWPDAEQAAAVRPGPELSAPPTTVAVATALDPGLAAAFRAAVAAAADAGHDLTLTSGFRTAAEQQVLLDEAIAEHGSVEEALRWVFPPERSMHVRGLAVDVGDGDAADWLDRHGASFGLCRTLAWEWWHFEWRGAWEASGACPRPAREPAEAPGA